MEDGELRNRAEVLYTKACSASHQGRIADRNVLARKAAGYYEELGNAIMAERCRWLADDRRGA